ncbi:MAG: hypothetical protein M3Y64_07760 [Gemmatimonadota bacterium]|nr:hypothetical protein [Gemmatimonadota bacterium]
MNVVQLRRVIAVVVLPVLCIDASRAFAQAATKSSRAQSRDALWSDSTADSLVARAIRLRGTQLADSTLLSYHADAHGFLAFLAALGDGSFIPPKVVQSEELGLTISWWQPGRSAQQLVGRRDTTLLPAQVGYYRDRYAVVLDNLPDRIRLGDGLDVADVPHPLGSDAPTRYEYRRGDGFNIRIPGRSIFVDEVQFRPRDASKPSAVGSVYLDHETGAVVRLSMTFTRAAILDKRIETLVLTLENNLVNARYWLPRRQEVEVSRSSTWLDLPVRGIVRAHWEISNYQVNERIPPAVMTMPRWSSVSRDSLRAYHFDGQVADVLPPEMRMASDEDVAEARQMAEAAVQAVALTRARKSAAYGRGVSDLLRVSRAEGVAFGAGLSRRWGNAWQSTLSGRFGISDREAKGRFTLGRTPAMGGPPLLEAFIERDYRNVASSERSGVSNSLGTLIFGSDFTTQVETRAAGINWRKAASSNWTLRVAAEADYPLALHGTPITGTYLPTLPAWTLRGGRAEFRQGGSSFDAAKPANRRSWSLTVSAGAYRGENADSARSPIVARSSGDITFERAIRGSTSLVLRSSLGVAGGRDVPPQWLVFAGGPTSAPGYVWSSLAGKIIASQRVEVHFPMPAPAIPLGRFGRAPGRIILAPFLQATALGASARGVSGNVDGVYPSAGVGALFFFDLLRFDAARDLRHRRWSFGIDIDRAFWGIL